MISPRGSRPEAIWMLMISPVQQSYHLPELGRRHEAIWMLITRTAIVPSPRVGQKTWGHMDAYHPYSNRTISPSWAEDMRPYGCLSPVQQPYHLPELGRRPEEIYGCLSPVEQPYRLPRMCRRLDAIYVCLSPVEQAYYLPKMGSRSEAYGCLSPVQQVYEIGDMA